MNEKIKMVVFVLLLGSVLTAALVAVNDFTEPYVKKNRLAKLRKSVLEALGFEFTTERIDQVFQAGVKTTTRDSKDFYVTKNGNLAFVFSGSGLWGEIEGVLCVKNDLETIEAVTIFKQNETPGLGARIAESKFLERFKNKKLLPELLILPPGKATGDNQIDGITGATLSCKALEQILNSEAKKYLALYREK